MKKKLPHTLQFSIYVFLISVLINTSVVTPHILTAHEHSLTAREFNTAESLNIILLAGAISVVVFAASGIILYLFATILSKMKRQGSFWFLMLIGIVSSMLFAVCFENIFSVYNDETDWISAIFGFSVMVSLASQYQFFLGENATEETNIA